MSKGTSRWLLDHWKFLAFIVVLFALPFLIPGSVFENIKSTISERGPFEAIIILALVLITTTVIAPLNSVVLIPFASALLGWPTVFCTMIVSWSIGATIAFLIARHFGQPALKALGIFDEAMSLVSKIPPEHAFGVVVILRILIPVDVLSYALGLISSMPLSQYILATVIGVTPFSFIWSYAGEVAISQDYPKLAAIATVVLVFFVIVAYIAKKRGSK